MPDEDIAYNDDQTMSPLPEPAPAGTTAPSTTTGTTSKKNELRGPLLSLLLSIFVLGSFYIIKVLIEVLVGCTIIVGHGCADG